MKLGIKHIAVAVALVFGALSANPAPVQAQLTQAEIDAELVRLLPAGGGTVQTATLLAAFKALMAANPESAAAIATAAGQRVPTIAAGIGGIVAEALAGSNLSATDQAAQMSAAAQGLAAANPAAAIQILQAAATAAPALASAASGGVQNAPGVTVNAADVAAIVAAAVVPAAGPAPPPVIVVVIPPTVTPPELVGPQPDPDPVS